METLEVSEPESSANTITNFAKNLEGVDWVELFYADIHGYPRGKAIPRETFIQQVIPSGCTFHIDSLICGLNNNPTRIPGYGFRGGFPDMRAKPVLHTLRPLSWEGETAWCIAHVEDIHTGEAIAVSPRYLLERVEKLYLHLGYTPIVGPEQEFYLVRISEEGQIFPYTNHPSMFFTTGRQSDPDGVVRDLAQAAKHIGLLVKAAHHEGGRGQFEINVEHSTALDAADRAFLLKKLVKERALAHGLQATFMASPFAGEIGSGFHMHLSIKNQDGANVFAHPGAQNGLSPLAKHFLAGVLKHAPALMAFLAPTVNGYRRLLQRERRVPLVASWAYNNRNVFVRVPAGCGESTRLEVRAAEATTNPYLAIAVTLLAGLDGIQRELEPPELVISRDISQMIGVDQPLPRSLDASLTALRADTGLCETIGWLLVDVFCDVKKAEIKYFSKEGVRKEEDKIATDNEALAQEREYYLWHL